MTGQQTSHHLGRWTGLGVVNFCEKMFLLKSVWELYTLDT